jgi:hypothetical protein
VLFRDVTHNRLSSESECLREVIWFAFEALKESEKGDFRVLQRSAFELQERFFGLVVFHHFSDYPESYQFVVCLIVIKY